MARASEATGLSILLVNGQEFAASRGPVIPSLTDWEFFPHRQLSVPTLPRNHWLTLADLTKQDGEIALVVKANGQPIKTYKTRVSGAQIQRLPQNALNAEPHAGFISPRFIDTSSGANSRYKNVRNVLGEEAVKERSLHGSEFNLQVADRKRQAKA